MQSGQLVAVDVGTIDGHPFVNTASFGSYSKLVEAREQLEDSIGKWPALGRRARARAPRRRTVSRSRSTAGRDSIWMIFVGNCAYDPPGFAPATRARLDDGTFDVRIVDGSHPYARLRLIAAALTGNLARSRVYSRRLVSSLDFVIDSANQTLAADGEVFPGHAAFGVAKHSRRLLVYAPD